MPWRISSKNVSTSWLLFEINVLAILAQKTCFCSARCWGKVTSTRTSLIPLILNVPPARHRMVLQRGRRRKDKKDKTMHRGKETKADKKKQRGQSVLKVHGKWPRLIIATDIVLINLQGSLLKGSQKRNYTYSRKFHFFYLSTVSSWQVVFFRGFLLSWIIQAHLTTF